MVSQLLFTAFSNRADAVQLAREAGRQLESDGITSSLHLLDVDATPVVDASTVVVSLGGDGTFLKSARLAHAIGARVLAVNLGPSRVPPQRPVQRGGRRRQVRAVRSDDVVDRLALLITVSGTHTQGVRAQRSRRGASARRAHGATEDLRRRGRVPHLLRRRRHGRHPHGQHGLQLLGRVVRWWRRRCRS